MPIKGPLVKGLEITPAGDSPSVFLLLAGGKHPPHNRRIQFVLALDHIPVFIFDAKNENRQRTFLVEIFGGHGHGKKAIQAMFAIGGFVAVLVRVPGEYADLVEIIRRAVVRLGKRAEILRNVFVAACLPVSSCQDPC